MELTKENQDALLVEHAEKAGFVREATHHGKIVLHKRDVSLILTIRQSRDISFPAVIFKQYRYELERESNRFFVGNETILDTDNFDEMLVFLRPSENSEVELLAIQKAVQFDDDTQTSLMINRLFLYEYASSDGRSPIKAEIEAHRLLIRLTDKYEDEGFAVLEILDGTPNTYMIKTTPSVQNPLEVELLKLKLENER